jgi:peptidyl-prolyl cis-trans isomerase C
MQERPLRVREEINLHFQESRRPHGKARGGRIAGYLTDEERSQAGWIGALKCEVIFERALRLFLVLLTVISLVFMAISVFAVEKPLSDGKVAVVNGTVIPRAEFDRGMERAYGEFASTGRPLNASQLPEVKKGVIESLINQELLYQESQNKSIKVEDKKIDAEMDALKKRFPSEKEYNTALAKMNLSEAEIKSQITKGMAIQQFIETKFVQKITVSDDETKAHYNNNLKMFKQPEQVRAMHILIMVAPQATEEQKAAARKKLHECQKKLGKGEDFEALAKEHSEGPSGAKGGDLGYFSRGQMVPSFEEVAFALKSGEVSDIVETRFGYHLIKVVDKKPGSTMSYEEVKDNLKQYMKQQKIQEQVKLYIEKLEKKAKVERFIPENPK